jgi:tetratricopeptide (TPR) repeat protein
MRKPNLTAALLAVSATFLTGCQGLFGGSHHARKDAGEAADRDPTAYAAIQLQTGRKALDNHQYAEAISAFRTARQEPGLAPEAYNGLAIAYANLGRQDLSVRYFNQAIALAPTDERFKSNLARLYRTSVVPTDAESVRTAVAQAEQQAAALNPASAAKPALASAGLKGPVTVARPAAQVTRVSDREVRIGMPAASPAVRVVRAANATISVETPTQRKRETYPVRLSLGSAGGTASQAYPIRIGLTPAP